MGRLYSRQHSEPRHVPQWEKDCPACGKPVGRETAVLHLSASHGACFRLETWIHTLGMPEATFDELLAFVRKLSRRAPAADTEEA